MSESEMKDMFSGFDPQQYEAEAEQRWGKTDAYNESKRRTSRYTREHWQEIKAEAEAAFAALAALLTAGKPADGVEAMAAAELHRQHIERWFYPCPRTMHRGLGQLYVDDLRFTANIDRISPGLAQYAALAFAANAGRE